MTECVSVFIMCKTLHLLQETSLLQRRKILFSVPYYLENLNKCICAHILIIDENLSTLTSQDLCSGATKIVKVTDMFLEFICTVLEFMDKFWRKNFNGYMQKLVTYSFFNSGTLLYCTFCNHVLPFQVGASHIHSV